MFGKLYHFHIFEYSRTNTHRYCLSPRAMAQGFVSINENIKIYRESYRKKLNILFDVWRELDVWRMHNLYVSLSPPLHYFFKSLTKKKKQIRHENVITSRKYLMETREDFRHTLRLQDFNQRRRARRKMQHLADQKRRWVRYYRPSGKPDRKRRYGRPWDPCMFIFHISLTFPISNTNNKQICTCIV